MQLLSTRSANRTFARVLGRAIRSLGIAASLALLFLVAGCSTQRPLPTIDLPEGTKLILPSLMEAENIRTIFPVDSEHYSKIVELPRGYQLTPQRNERH